MVQFARLIAWTIILLTAHTLLGQNNLRLKASEHKREIQQQQSAEDLDQCFNKVIGKKKLHRIDKEDSLYNCLEINKSRLTKNICFQKVKKLNNVIHSTQLNTRLKAICFYEAGTFETIKSCIKSSQEFELANEHDDALFYCYQSFQDTITQSQCISLADQFKFPLKKDYLKRHCLQN